MKTPTEEQIKKAYDIILEKAKGYQHIYYGDLYERVGLDPANIEDRLVGMAMLGAVNEIYSKDHLLTSFVVSKAGNGPFAGYYTCADEFGLLSEGCGEVEKYEFWLEEMKAIWEKERSKP